MATPGQPDPQLRTQLVCPDPSAHEYADQKLLLQHHSANAALYVTHPERATNVRDFNLLGPDGKLSSAGAATSLKYARAQDLPSYPSAGVDTKNWGLTAASLAHANPRNIQAYKPEMSQDAGKAAMLAKDYKMAPTWQAEASTAGSKAALLAHQAKRPDWWEPTPSKDGLRAATLATQNKKLSPQLDNGHTEDGRNKALLAATLSVKARKRAESTPDPTPSQNDNTKRMSNSLKAATMAHADGLKSRAIEQSRITHARNLSRDLYTERPNVDIEKEERAHQDALKGASISMAKKMYAMERVDDNGHVTLSAGQAARTAERSSVVPNNDLRQQAMQYLTLQDAAQRLAAERLAKIEDQHESAAFRDYYGYSHKRRSRLTFKGRNRRRASSDGNVLVRRNNPVVESPPASPKPHRRNLDVDSDDEEQAARVRSQMNRFNAKLAEADKRRLHDRETLMAAAERKVQAQMSKMDEKVFNETGKMSPAMMQEWDNKARQKAAAASQLRMQNHGRVDVGGGKFLDQSEIHAIALASIKPTLDEINATAEKQRARDEEVRLEKDEQRRQYLKEKERDADNKTLMRRMKTEDRKAERTRRRDEKNAAENEKAGVKEEGQQDMTATRMPLDAAREKSGLEMDGAREPNSPSQKRSSWKKFLPHRHGRDSREPGKISREKPREPTYGAVTVPEPEPEPEVEQESEEEEEKEGRDEIELTPTGATMSGDDPASIAAPEVLPHTEVASSAQVITPVEEHPGFIRSGTRQTATNESEDNQTSPASPSKKRFSRFIGKFKRSQNDKKDEDEEGTETSSFTGGAKLHKKRHEEPETKSASTAADTSVAVGPSAPPERASSPSISSLSSEDEEDEREERGRSATRLNQMAEHVMAIQDSDGENDTDNFEEAYDRFDESELAPPKTLLSKKTESPIRDSKFHENI